MAPTAGHGEAPYWPLDWAGPIMLNHRQTDLGSIMDGGVAVLLNPPC